MNKSKLCFPFMKFCSLHVIVALQQIIITAGDQAPALSVSSCTLITHHHG